MLDNGANQCNAEEENIEDEEALLKRAIKLSSIEGV